MVLEHVIEEQRDDREEHARQGEGVVRRDDGRLVLAKELEHLPGGPPQDVRKLEHGLENEVGDD